MAHYWAIKMTYGSIKHICAWKLKNKARDFQKNGHGSKHQAVQQKDEIIVYGRE